MLAVPRKAVFENDDLVGLAAPCPDELGAGTKSDAPRFRNICLGLECVGERVQLPFRGRAMPTQSTFLDLPGDTEFEKIPVQKLGWILFIELPPCRSQFGMARVTERCNFLGCALLIYFSRVPYGSAFPRGKAIGFAAGMGIKVEVKAPRFQPAQRAQN